MFSLVYSSTAVAGFKPIDLAELVMVCRRNNDTLGVTGMLLFEQGQFLQAIEGSEDTVRELMRTIERDRRHEQIQRLAEGEADARRFPDWAMGYARIDDEEAAPLANYSTMLSAIRRPEPEDQTPRAKSLREWMRRTRGATD